MKKENLLAGAVIAAGSLLILNKKSKKSVSGISGNFSSNKKLDKVLSKIKDQLLSIHYTPEESINEIKHYKKEFPREIDYNLFQYGNMLIYTDDIRELYKDYKSLQKVSDQAIVDIYKRQVGYVAREILKNN